MSTAPRTAALARAIAAVCGPHRTLHVGAGDGALVGELLAQGVDAFGLTLTAAETAAGNGSWPGRFASDPVSAIADGSCTTVVADAWLDVQPDDLVGAALAQLRRISTGFVVLDVGGAGDAPKDQPTTRTRAWWETRCFAAGLRLHPAPHRIPAAVLAPGGTRLLLPLERCPEAPTGDAGADRAAGAAADILRTTGPRAAADRAGYRLAAQFVRPGDEVLDLGCGRGAGSHILHQVSLARSVLGVDADDAALAHARRHYGREGAVDFARGAPPRLASLPAHSVDFVTAIAALDEPGDPEPLLEELRRLLRPAGRVLLGGAVGGADAGAWGRMLQQVGRHFVAEKAFVPADAGGGAWSEVPLAAPPPAGRVLLLAMADPLLAAGVPYRETSWPLPDDPGFHVLAFARDYRNPWLAKAMVTIGMRLDEPNALRALQDRVLQAAPADSTDHGAALCGLAYTTLAQARIDADEHARLMAAIRDYTALPADPPHRLRWQVSLLFVGGELARKRGDFVLARRLYQECADRDAARYSPLLGNRTVDALFRLATLGVAEGDLARARELLQRSVAETRRLVAGSWLNVCGSLAQPIPAGLAELAQLLDKASRAAYALSVLDSARQRPAVFAWEARGWFERVLAGKDDELADLRRGRDTMRQQVLQLNERMAQLAAELTDKEARMHALGAMVVERDARVQDLTRQLATRTPRAPGLLQRLRRFFSGRG